jgi:uncharacterized protein
MKYFIFLSLLVVSFSFTVHAQKKQHQIIFELVSADTADHSAIIRQVNNVLKAAPDAKIEVVCHGPAVYALIKDKSYIKEKVDELVVDKRVIFAACANSLKRFNLSADQVISSAIIVPVAILEIVEKQEKGWSYIKSGH